MTMTMERVVEENGKTRGDEFTKDGTVDLKGYPVLRSNTGRWRATSFIVVLHLANIRKLEEWVEGVISNQSAYSTLESLKIKRCPRLRKIPSSCFPSLKVLEIEDLESSNILESMSRDVRSLTSC
ncbi:hypothetical protein ACET3Z_026348 [Daucus carota]